MVIGPLTPSKNMYICTDAIIKQELQTRDEQISDLTSKYTSEFELREKTEAERDNLASNLVCIVIQIFTHTRARAHAHHTFTHVHTHVHTYTYQCSLTY